MCPAQASRLVIELADFDKPGKHQRHRQHRGSASSVRPEWRQKVKPLANIGGLVKYPMGAGGILLNQVLVKPAEANPVNAQKKGNIVTALLRNLHATFAGSKVLTTANLKYQPLPLGEHCNQYLSKDRGWFDGPRDLASLPVGTQHAGRRALPGPRFQDLARAFLRDVGRPRRQGPVAQGGQGPPGRCKADVLFFLHAFNSRDPGAAGGSRRGRRRWPSATSSTMPTGRPPRSPCCWTREWAIGSVPSRPD